MGRGLLLGAALALLATSAAAAGWGPCETVTGIAGCTECLAAPAKTCQMCHHTRSAKWTNGKITAVSTGARREGRGARSAAAAPSGSWTAARRSRLRETVRPQH